VSQGLAIGALVCGIIGLVGCPPVGIVGLVLGIVAVVKASQAPERFGGKGLAIGGICTGAASLLVVPLMISILLPSLSRARELSKRTVCGANMRAIGQAMHIYAQDGGMFPEEGADWQGRLVGAGLTMPQQFLCPSDSLVSGSSYYYVPGYGVESDPEQVILYEDPAIHGGEGGNILTQDGHVGFVRSPRYEEMIDSITLPDGTPWAPHKGP
jgi:prepilin-type processing-associated H-X9-DG protein